MKYIQRAKNIDSAKHNIGKSPNMEVLNRSRENLLHHTTYSRNRELLSYAGCPEVRFGSGSISGDYDCSFYIIYPVRGTTGDKMRIGFNLTTWDRYDVDGNCNFKWDGVASDKLANTSVLASTTQYSSSSTLGFDKPNGIRVSDNIELDFDHNDIGGYGYVKVSFDRLVPASFSSWIMPIYEPDYNALDSTYGSQAFNLSESAFNIGQSLRGSSSDDDTNGSVGTLCQRQFDDGADTSNMVSNSELCLFQFGHPAGIFVEGSSGTLADKDVFGYNIKIKGRELLEDNTGLLDMVLVYRADAGTSIKLTVDSTGTTYTTGFSNESTPKTEIVFSDIPFDGSGDELTIEANVSNLYAVEIKSIAIFEKTY